MAAGAHGPTARMLGQLRLNIAKRENLLDPNRFEFLWVVDFPMFDWLEDEKRWEFMHHPFTAPLESDADRLESDPGSVRARAYDMVLNGSEIGGGSIRIHDQRLQKLVFKLLGMSDEEAKARFGFFVDALEFGTPPHGGIALGPRPHRRDPGGGAVDSRGDRVPEDRAGGRPHVGRAVDGGPETAQGTAHPHPNEPQARLRQGYGGAGRAKLFPRANLRDAQDSDPRGGG